MAKKIVKKDVKDITHDEAKRPNIPTSEMKPLVADSQKAPIKVAFEKRNPDLDPQLIWRGKYDGDETLTVKAPPLYIQEKVHPKALIEDLKSVSAKQQRAEYLSLFGDFNGMPKGVDKTDFYKHEQNWTNRMILGDSLQVMASLAEREKLRGKVQMIYIDPPYGIKFNSNFQFSTNSRDVKDGKDYTREPEQVKAFRDTWEDGIHSYLGYLRDRLIVARDLLTESGSVFVQIGDENVHLVRTLMDEVFGQNNYCREILYVTTSFQADRLLANTVNRILWYAKNKEIVKVNNLYGEKSLGSEKAQEYKWILLPDGTHRSLTKKEINLQESLPIGSRPFRYGPLTSQGYSETGSKDFEYNGKTYSIGKNQHWKVSQDGLTRLQKANQLIPRENSLSHYMFLDYFPITPLTNIWQDTKWGFDAGDKQYIVQTNVKVIEKCVLLATDPGDLVLDPTCGSGTTAYVAEQWGRRWITIDTSRVALALARARLMGAKYPYYLMADSKEGQKKEAEISGTLPSDSPLW